MKRARRPRRRPAAEGSSRRSRNIPEALELAIAEQRNKVGIGITLGYCLHLWSRCEVEQMIDECDDQVEEAIQWADRRQITSMLLVILHSIHAGLDTVSLQAAGVDPEDVLLEKRTRKVANGRGRKRGGA